MNSNQKFLKRSPLALASAVAAGAILAVGFSVWATSVGTDITATGDLTVTSGARVGTGSTGDHLTALAADSFLVEGEAEFDGIAWFDGSLRASSTLMVTGATTLGANGTALTQVLTGYVACGRIGGSGGPATIAATSTGVLACQGELSNVTAGDAVFLTATSSTSGLPMTNGAGTNGAGVIFSGKASTTAANVIQMEVTNLTGAAWTIATSTWRYLIIR